VTTPVVILGCSGNCVDILDSMLACNRAAGSERYRPLGYLDDDPARQGQSLYGFPVLGPLSMLAELPDPLVITAIGSSTSFASKPALLHSLKLPRERFVSVIHPSAAVSEWAQIGLGCAIFQQATLCAGSRLDDHVVILPGSVVSHDAHIGDCSILAGGVIVSGFVRVESNCYLGAGSTIRERLTIGSGSLVGMGSVVVRSVLPGAVVMGNPARQRPSRAPEIPGGMS
jgi:sugar O-acyltransferase (sialic acid O-acetyltransferase NeuD family)